MSEYPLPAIPPELARACVEDECVLYAGSGLSAQAGYPTWIPMLWDLLNWVDSAGFIEPSFALSLRAAMEVGDYNSVSDSLVRALGHNQVLLRDHLLTMFYAPQVKLPEVCKILRQIPFAALLTTNFDNLLETTFDRSSADVLTPYDAEKLIGCLSRRESFLLKLYGDVAKPDTILLSPAQYLHATQENLVFSQFMETLFFSRTLLFVGASLQGIADYLSGIKFQGTAPPRRHYCLIDVQGTAWRAKASNLEARYNITVLPYSASEDYREVPQFLSALSREVSQLKQTAPVATPTQFPVTHIKRVRLENIGPFEDQSFDLTTGWNILFGDNGVGKSNFLKAVAVGLCGESAKTYADRMVKTKTAGGTTNPTGTITIDVVTDINGEKRDKTFVSRIFKSDFGGDMSARPPRPLESEGWLAVGFPPMRIISWKREQLDQPSIVNRPMPSDLLPLIVGESDPRLDSLKSWLIDLDNRINRDLKNGIPDSPSLRLRKDFFEVIAALTPKVEIDFAAIGEDGKTVLVKTADGLVPIEAVSQGTSSLMGWVGVLLRRLFDLYESAEKPREQHALVLIDEIDAHMHPEWQRQLIPKIRELFPNLQVIATTHSPLLVPSLKPREIIRLRREPGVKGITVDVPRYDLREFPTNQILTSPLFDVDTSLPPELSDTLNRYKELTAKDDLTDEEKIDLERVAMELNVRLPTPKEKVEARIAYNMIQAAMAQKLVDLSMESRQEVEKEIKVQLEELITGSRAPR